MTFVPSRYRHRWPGSTSALYDYIPAGWPANWSERLPMPESAYVMPYLEREQALGDLVKQLISTVMNIVTKRPWLLKNRQHGAFDLLSYAAKKKFYKDMIAVLDTIMAKYSPPGSPIIQTKSGVDAAYQLQVYAVSSMFTKKAYECIAVLRGIDHAEADSFVRSRDEYMREAFLNKGSRPQDLTFYDLEKAIYWWADLLVPNYNAFLSANALPSFLLSPAQQQAAQQQAAKERAAEQAAQYAAEQALRERQDAARRKKEAQQAAEQAARQAAEQAAQQAAQQSSTETANLLAALDELDELV